MTLLETLQGDITTQQVDAIVNAANEALVGGVGVNGAIHKAVGPELLVECQGIGGCPTGEARLTKGYRLPAPYVIHTVGPVWHGGGHGEAERLASCYRESLALADRHDLRSIAFPAISTGVFGYPPASAAEVAVSTTRAYVDGGTALTLVRFVCFDAAAYQTYRGLLDT